VERQQSSCRKFTFNLARFVLTASPKKYAQFGTLVIGNLCAKINPVCRGQLGTLCAYGVDVRRTTAIFAPKFIARCRAMFLAFVQVKDSLPSVRR
jgi:hypothetical protein